MVVAHDFCRARDVQQALQHAGAKVVGPFKDSQSALSAVASHAVCCAIIDVDAGGEEPCRIASALVDAGTPVVFLSATQAPQLPSHLQAAPLFASPPDYRSLVGLVAEVAVKADDSAPLRLRDDPAPRRAPV
jgi:DNA-binding NarL/FixJ family response regulator